MSLNKGKAQAPFSEAGELAAALRVHLEWLRETGVDGLALARVHKATVEKELQRKGGDRIVAPVLAGEKGMGDKERLLQKDAEPVRGKAAPLSGELFGEPSVAAAGSLKALAAVLAGCQRCKLAPSRMNIVFGVGNPRADIMFVGEGPGRDEDAQGEPFVGRAGQLLTRIITNGMKLKRADVYIANIVKCRPPENRNPQPDEVAACLPFLARQIELINPKVIVVLGSVAVQALLRIQSPITRIRGVWQEYMGIPVMPTFHPAYLLRNPGQKAAVWEDIKKVMDVAGVRQ